MAWGKATARRDEKQVLGYVRLTLEIWRYNRCGSSNLIAVDKCWHIPGYLQHLHRHGNQIVVLHSVDLSAISDAGKVSHGNICLLTD